MKTHAKHVEKSGMMRINMSQINGLVVIMIVDDGSIISVPVINECQLHKEIYM